MNNEFMKRAIELSRKNIESGGGPFGAVIVRNGKIIGEGWNKVTANNDPTAHAEVEAIRISCQNEKNFDLTGAELYTSCEPCPMCLSAVYWARISKVYFANTKKDAAAINFNDDFIYTEIPKPISERQIPMIQMMHQEALEVFEAWDASLNKISY
jgi:guanine deaminase